MAHAAVIVTAKARVRSFLKDLYEDGGKLFCKARNVVLDHTRLSTIHDHLGKSEKQDKCCQEID